jgi:transposase-like protein
MDEDSLRFWIAPILCMVVGMGVFVGVVEYNTNTKMPNAAAELEEMRTMSCEEIKAKDSLNNYWTSDNREFGGDKMSGCAAAEAAIRKAENDRLDKLLEDPNSFESLSRDLIHFQGLYDSYQELYEMHSSEAEILKHNVTDFENQINEINSKLEQEYGLK